MWVKCKDKLPPKHSVCRIKYSDGTITHGVYCGDRTWFVKEATVDKSVYVESWYKQR